MPKGVKCQCGHVFAANTSGGEVVCPACGKRGTTKSTRSNSYDVFLSHASEDKAVADAACAALERAGLRCWIAPRDIVPGAKWSEAIIDGLEHSRSVVLVLTTHSNNSQPVHNEVEQAMNRKIPILPLRVEDVLPSKSLSFFVSSHHWLNAFTGPLESHLDALATAVRQLLAGQTVTAPTPPTNKTAARFRATRRYWYLGIPIALVVIAALTAWSPWTKAVPDPTPTPTPEPAKTGDPLLPGYVKVMRKKFAESDKNNDKRLGPRELSVRERDSALDANHDGSVDWAEYLEMCHLILLARDKDHDGKLSEQEFSATDSESLPNVNPNARRQYPFSKYDFNGDGYVTLEELEQGWATYYIH